MASDIDRSRERGIELGEFVTHLEATAYPITKADLLDAHGSHELGLSNGDTVTVGSILEPAGVERFESRDGVLNTVYQMVGASAVGERGQTGRGTSNLTPPEGNRPPGKPTTEEETETSF
jgi:hypothetical protein